MNKEKCDECFDQLTLKGQETYLRIKKDADDLFTKMEVKHDSLMDKMEKRHNYLMLINLFLFGIFGTIIGVTWVNNTSKANISDVLTIKEAKVLRELGDAYYRTIFVQKENPPMDTTNYNWVMKGIFNGSLRSGNIINNNKN